MTPFSFCNFNISKYLPNRSLFNLSYNLLALIVALIVGGVGCVIYYQLTGIPYTTNNIIYIVLMGFASGLSSMVGYDKIKQMIQQFTKNEIIPKVKEEN